MPAKHRTVLDCCSWDPNIDGATELYAFFCTAIDGVTNDKKALKPFLASAGLEPWQIDWTGDMGEVWTDILQKTCKNRRLNEFARALTQLIENPKYEACLKALKDIGTQCPCGGGGGGNAPSPNGQGGSQGQRPFRGRVLSGPRPFIDRNELRTKLELLAQPNGSRVLVVNGPPQSGRSHIWFLVTEGCARLGVGHRAVRVQPSDYPIVASPPSDVNVVPSADPAPNGAWGPNELMTAIADKLGLPAPPTYDSQDDAKVTTLINWFQHHVAALGADPVWLVIDDLHAAYVTEAGRRLAGQVANAAATGQAGQLRVVLLCFDGSLSAETEPYACKEILGLLDADDVREFFADVASELGEQLEPDALARIVEKATGEKLNLTPFPLAELAPTIGAVANALLHPPEQP